MDSAKMRPDYLVGSLEYDTEFYADVKWHPVQNANAVSVDVDVDTSDEFFIDDIVCLDEHQVPVLKKTFFRRPNKLVRSPIFSFLELSICTYFSYKH